MSEKSAGPGELLRYSLANAPWALISSLSAGVANYIIIIILAKTYGLAASGQFRLLLSIYGMISLFTLMDSGKIAIKYLVQGETGVVRPLLRQRFLWGLAGSLTGLITAAVLYRNGDPLWLPLIVAAICVPIAQPASLFAQINQARKEFRTNALYNVTKYVVILGAAFALAYMNADVIWFLALFFILTAIFHVVFLWRQEETFQPDGTASAGYRKDALKLSASGIFPIMLEHADKFLVSYFFGLETLGLYVVGVSTGRLLLHFVKPVLTIYYPILVKKKINMYALVPVFLALTTLGLFTAYFVLDYYFANVLGAEYADATAISTVIVAGLGVYFLGVITYYSAVYHQDGNVRVPAITNIITASLTVLYMTVSLKFGGAYALILCAASYPLREFLNLLIIQLLHSRAKDNAIANAV